MHFWSEGLGDRELVMRLGRASVERKADMISLTGIVDSPAPWEYEVKIQFADWIKILQTANSKDACEFIAEHVRLGMLARMGWSIAKFVVLLALYRAAFTLGLDRLGTAAVHPSGVSGAKNSGV